MGRHVFALETVTTVGYGDLTPKDPNGRLVAALIMLNGIAFLAIITAAITSTFVTRATQEHRAAGDTGQQDFDARLDGLAEQLNRLESMIQSLALPHRD